MSIHTTLTFARHFLRTIQEIDADQMLIRKFKMIGAVPMMYLIVLDYIQAPIKIKD